LFKELNAKLRGYYNHYGVTGNYASLNQFFKSALRTLRVFKWLNRRSQRRSYNWTGFRELLQFFQVEQPYIVGRPTTSYGSLHHWSEPEVIFNEINRVRRPGG